MPATTETRVTVTDPKEGSVADYRVDLNVQCVNCKRLRTAAPIFLTCDAFPKGIPVEIAKGEHDHTQPFEGDKGKRYDPLDA